MKTNNADSPKIQLKPPALPVSYERITKPPTSVDVRPMPDAVATVTDALASERRKPLPKRRHVDLTAIDEAGAAEARRRHLRVTGTLGVLRSGAEQDLVKVPDLLERLKATSFYLDETLLNSVFEPWLKS